MQGAENESELLQNSAIFGGSVLHGEPVTLRPPEDNLQQFIGPSQVRYPTAASLEEPLIGR